MGNSSYLSGIRGNLRKTCSTWNTSGVRREKGQLPHGAEGKSYEKGPGSFACVREPAGNVTEEPQGQSVIVKASYVPLPYTTDGLWPFSRSISRAE